MLVREAMTATPVTVRPETPVKEALAALAEHRITSLPVVGGGRRLLGVVSEADLIRDLVGEDPRAHLLQVDETWHDRPVRVEDVMTPHAVSVHPETELKQAVELMTTTTVKSVPVVDDHGAVVGMLSRADVVRQLARADESLAAEVDSMLVEAGLDGWEVTVDQGVVTLDGPESDRAVADVVARTVPGVVDVVTE